MIGSSPELLSHCLDDVRAGRVSADDCFAAYPEAAAELAGLVSVANAIKSAPRIDPDPAFKARARAALLNSIVAERERRTSPLRRFWTMLVGDSTTSQRAEMPVSLFLAMAIAVGGSSAGVALAAQDALPGEPLYPVKAFGEVVQVTLAPSDDYRTALHLTYASRRLDEMELLQARKQLALVEQTTRRYTDHLDEAIRLSADRPISNNVSELVRRISKREQVLAQLSKEVPAPAAAAIAAAIDRTDVMEVAAAKPSQPKSNAPTPAGAPHPSLSAGQLVSASATAAAAGSNIERLSAAVAALTIAPAANTSTPEDPPEALAAKVAAASAAMARGQPETAANNLHAFANQLNAMQRSGRIVQADYDALYKSYADVALKLGSTAVPTVAANKTSSPPATQTTSTPQPGATESAKPTPTTPATATGTTEPTRTPGKRSTPTTTSTDAQ
ncbi:MAG: DUF5667 domain-containing protein [Chloroflexota bacterium]